jgi:hypothetical protein
VFVAGDAAHIHSPAGGQGMNTGMHDAVNLAWKLALVEQGLAATALLDTYDAERSPVAEQVLSDSGRLTRVATVREHLAQHVRNFVAHRLLGLPFVQHAMAERLSEITVSYPDSPMNRGAGSGLGPRPGQRIVADRPFGAGDMPRFALMATDDQQARALMQRYTPLLEPALRPPPDAAGIWLVRPDGYVAAVARAGDWHVIGDCLEAVATNVPPKAREKYRMP